ncbi:hypothetical protein SSTU70S_04050 [Stutzerimonas stutzeri]
MRRRARAFTLIELLVVIVLLGILVSLAVLTTGSSSTARELRDEARRIAALIGVLQRRGGARQPRVRLAGQPRGLPRAAL